MSLSGFGSCLADYVKDKLDLSLSSIVSYRIISLFLLTSLLIVSAGCNLTVHRKDGLGKVLLATPPASAPEVVEQVESSDKNNLSVAEVQVEPDQPALVAEEATGEQIEQDAGKAEAVADAVEIVASPIQETASEQDEPVDPDADLADQVAKAVNVSGKVVEVPGGGPRAVLASLKIPGGAKLSPIPVRLEEGGDGKAELPAEGIGALPEEDSSPPPESEPAAGDTEFTSAVNPTVSAPDASGAAAQEDKEGEKTENAAEPEKKPEEEPPGTGEGDSSGDDKADAGADADKAQPAPKEKSKFPYGLVIVVVVCLGIAIFQNTAGKSI
ncbi:MAG: hypothetical protein VX254_09720 [Planctomycetota bacterium]|nr:hypothetical protein [Planctomycetota bacterium]